MSTATALSADAIAWAVGASADITPPPSGWHYESTYRVLLITAVVLAGVMVVVTATRTALYPGTWSESLAKGPARQLIASTICLLTAAAAVTALNWATAT